MPSAELHSKQARHNKKFLNEKVFDPKKFLYPDWYVTACFYYTLHLIDGKLALMNGAYEHISEHKVRNNLIEASFKKTKYAEVIDLYGTLRIYSQTARYACVKINKYTVQKATECMSRIEQLLSS
ncbi:MAG: hypothetical protein GX770_01750 [Firmicutes bacterium]|nr:hypothetical protein [Bacillota bacterium]